MGDGFVGFNPDEVQQTIRGIESSYNDLINAVGNGIQEKFINGMSSVWAGNNAIEFFRNIVEPTFEKLIEKINMKYDEIVDGIANAANAWAIRTGSNYAMPKFALRKYNYDISVIRENINGYRGLMTDGVNEVVGRLTVIKDQADNALIRTTTAIVSHNSFIGDGQIESIVQKVNTIKNEINNIFGVINSNIQANVNEVLELTNQTAEKVVNNFSDISSIKKFE